MKKVFPVAAMAAMFLVLSSCGYTQEYVDDVRYEAYQDGYEDGYETGREEGMEETTEEMIDMGLIERVHTVFLSKNPDVRTYHGRYCDLADWDRQVLLQDALNKGLTPCKECGGGTETALAPAGTIR